MFVGCNVCMKHFHDLFYFNLCVNEVVHAMCRNGSAVELLRP